MAAVHILEIQNGKYQGRRVRLAESEVTIGRGDDCRVRIASSEVSREHCLLIPRGNGILVRDLGSRNGTFVDGRPIQEERLLAPGGTLTVGPMTFLLLGGQPKKPSSAEVAVLGKMGTDDQLSDDEIASWLSDDEIPTTSPESDTSIVTPQAPSPVPGTPSPLTQPVAAPTPKRKEFKSVAEEAQDIIRRHFESLEENAAES